MGVAFILFSKLSSLVASLRENHSECLILEREPGYTEAPLPLVAPIIDLDNVSIGNEEEELEILARLKYME